MQNSKLQKIFFKTFLITVLVIVIIAAIVMGAYVVVSKMFKEEPKPVPTETTRKYNIIADVKLGTPSFEVIYNADANDTVINDVIIAIFNTESGNLDYLTIVNPKPSFLFVIFHLILFYFSKVILKPFLLSYISYIFTFDLHII